MINRSWDIHAKNDCRLREIEYRQWSESTQYKFVKQLIEILREVNEQEYEMYDSRLNPKPIEDTEDEATKFLKVFNLNDGLFNYLGLTKDGEYVLRGGDI